MRPFGNIIFIQLLFFICSVLNAQFIKTSCPHENNISVLTVKDENIYAGSSGSGVYLSTDEGVNWNSIGLDDQIISTLVFNGDILFAGTSNGIQITTDNGSNWSLFGLSGINIKSILLYKDLIIAGTERQGIYVSKNNGLTWTTHDNRLSGSSITVLANSENTIFAGTFCEGLFKSSSRNLNFWNHVNSLSLPFCISDIVVNDNNIFIGTDYRVFHSTNFGSDFEEVGPNIIVVSLVSKNGNMFAGTAMSRVFYSGDNWSTWEIINNDYVGSAVNAIAVSDNYIFIAASLGVYRRPLSEIGITDIDDDLELPSEFSLDQNYPNPFNPTTTIKYSIPQSVGNEDFRSVQLKIYDVLGNEIATLVDEQKSPGTYEVSFDGTNHSSGIYFYSLRAGHFFATKKFVMMK